METYKPTAGPPEVAIVLNPNLYKFGQFIGAQIVSPIQREVPDFGKKLVSVSAFQLSSGKRSSVKVLTPHIKELLEYCDIQGITTIICVNAQYFEMLTKQKFMDSLGTVKPCIDPEYSHITVIPLLSPALLQKYPNKAPVVRKGINTVIAYLKGEYKEASVTLKSYKMLVNPGEIKSKLDELLKYPMIAWDIETTGLKHAKVDIITHAFAINEEEAWTTVCHEKYTKGNTQLIHNLLKDFFRKYEGKWLIHNVGFEAKFYAWKYFMRSWDDYESMYTAINNMDFEDTLLLAKAARNSVDRENFGLKSLAADRFGDWDADINVKQALNEPIEKLAFYNAIDTCATFYVWNTVNKEITDKQKHFYNTIMKDVQRLFNKLMLTGLPVHMPTVLKVEKQLQDELKEAERIFFANHYVQEAEEEYRRQLADKYNATHKVMRKTADDFLDAKLNYQSSAQKSLLLFDVMNYEPIEFSDLTNNPKTGKNTVFEYLQMETDETKKEVLKCLDNFSKISIVLNTFIKTLKTESIQVDGDHYRLYGNLVNAGAVSYRPTANNP